MYFSPKQEDFILNANAKINLAHGPMRSGKTMCVVYKFLEEVLLCPGEQIWLIGYTQDAIYQNVVRFILDKSNKIFGPFAAISTWMPGNKLLKIGKKTIYCLGASDESSVGQIQGKTFDLCYCNEMTLFPDNVIQTIFTRLSMPHSKLFADMNPTYPTHLCKKWIDLARSGDKTYYELSWSIDDNPFLTDDFKKSLKQTLSGLFLRRNYYGEWCLAEGAIFDFFDDSIHVVDRPPTAADYWIAGIDYGTDHAFACILVGISEGNYSKPAIMWAEKEYYYDYRATGRQKSPSEFVDDLTSFFGDIPLRAVYVDPSAAPFRQELRRAGIRTNDTDNEVYAGITLLTNMIKNAQLVVCKHCKNLIREMKTYVWDPKKSKSGKEEPFKQNDDAVDAFRYAIKSHMKNRTRIKPDNRPDDPNFGRSLGMRF